MCVCVTGLFGLGVWVFAAGYVDERHGGRMVGVWESCVLIVLRYGYVLRPDGACMALLC